MKFLNAKWLTLTVSDNFALRNGMAVEGVVDGHCQSVGLIKVQMVRDDHLKWEVTS
jgi:hypothetical protein